MLKENKLRIQAIAMTHEALYSNHDLDKVGFKNYTTALSNLINEAYGREISVKVDSNQISLPIETMFKLASSSMNSLPTLSNMLYNKW